MPNYDWTDFRDLPLTERFPDWAEGLQWLGEPPEEALFHIVEQRRHCVRPPRPRVFVSHRQSDVGLAKQIAYEVCTEGFEFWLDVFDPNLAAAMNAPPPVRSYAVAIAIEMGLLNSTHVIAVMTKNIAGSQWVPYEYGRVKDPTPVALQAASWIDFSFPTAKFPEYLLLGPELKSKAQLDAWLRFEVAKYGSPPPCGWIGRPPASL